MAQLTTQQIQFFETFGYLKFPGLFAADIEAITRHFEDVFTSRGGGHNGQKHDGRQRSMIFPFIDQSVNLSALLDDPRIHAIATSLLGEDFNHVSSDGNYYTGDTVWHTDGWHIGIRHIKLAFYLDPLTRETGALRVIPGSHDPESAFAQALKKGSSQPLENWDVAAADVPAVALETVPGDVVCFNHNISHASFGGSSVRRMFTMNLCQRYPEERLQELRDYIGGHSRFWIDRNYGEIMMETAGPERLRHLEQIMANDGHLADLSRKAREAMGEPSRG